MPPEPPAPGGFRRRSPWACGLITGEQACGIFLGGQKNQLRRGLGELTGAPASGQLPPAAVAEAYLAVVYRYAGVVAIGGHWPPPPAALRNWVGWVRRHGELLDELYRNAGQAAPSDSSGFPDLRLLTPRSRPRWIPYDETEPLDKLIAELRRQC